MSIRIRISAVSRGVVTAWFAAEFVFIFVSMFLLGSNRDILFHGVSGNFWFLRDLERIHRVEFVGVANLYNSLFLGVVTWWMGVISIPIFLFPAAYTFLTKGRAVVDGLTKRPRSSREPLDKLKHRLLIAFMIACSLYYIFKGYFSGDPIVIKSEFGGVVTVTGISFGPAAVILLVSAFLIDFLASETTPDKGASNE
ncbi:hypothetical protein [Burkholderia sp. MSMB1072]|uniref:hypothetical protein n=1 Tax=Burkholderia sp. MSMB1072 TaxID=1637871 RepID=UPI0012E36EBE|nr:hypothetical protein [Burkholderia sp. MSMB1072]